MPSTAFVALFVCIAVALAVTLAVALPGDAPPRPAPADRVAKSLTIASADGKATLAIKGEAKAVVFEMTIDGRTKRLDMAVLYRLAR